MTVPRTLIMVVLAVQPFACTSEPVRPSLPERSSLRQSPLFRQPPVSLDEHFAMVADRAPGFAGMYFDNGVLIIRRTASSSLSNIREALLTDESGLVSPPTRGTIQGGSVRDLSAEYDFRQLLTWKRRIYASAPLDGVVLVDIDEVKNRIHFAMTTVTQASSLTSAIRALGIPDAAVHVSHGHYASRDKSLSDQFRPVPGGVQIEPSSGGTCTLNVNVLVDNDDYFVANSHCSDRFGDGGDGSYMYQNTIGPSKLIGQEVVDPDLIAPGVGDCPTWAWVVGCRYSDAALFAYVSTNLADFGTIARTTGIKSKTVSTFQPRFYVGSVSWSYPYVGTTVNMMGSNSGWTTGDVTLGMDPSFGGNTCVDYNPPPFDPIVSLCQVAAGYSRSGGDSGGPIFTWDGSSSSVELIGIHVGGFDGGGVFSPWLYVSWEVEAVLGPWEIVY